MGTFGEEKGARGGVIELASVVTLHILDSAAKLSHHKREKVRECGKSLRLETKRKGPQVVRIIIKND